MGIVINCSVNNNTEEKLNEKEKRNFIKAKKAYHNYYFCLAFHPPMHVCIHLNLPTYLITYFFEHTNIMIIANFRNSYEISSAMEKKCKLNFLLPQSV